MLSKEQIIRIMQQSAESLQRSGIIENEFSINPGTIILGTGSPLDSISFVTLVTDVEERLAAATGQDIAITLVDIDSFNENDPNLSVDRFAEYLLQLASR